MLSIPDESNYGTIFAMTSDYNIPLIVGGESDQDYRSIIKSQPVPVRIARVDQVVANPSIVARVTYMRAGYGGDFLSEKYLTCFKAEKILKAAGGRVINPVHATSLAHRKDIVYEELRRNGVSIPWALSNPSIPEILVAIEAGDLSFPFVYRLADSHSGIGMILVKNMDDLQKADSAFKSNAFAPFRRTLVTKYVTEKTGNLFSKTRLYVIGPKVDMIARTVNKDWICIFLHPGFEAQQFKANSEYRLPSALEKDAVKVGKVLGLGVYAVDAMEENGKHYIVDVNPTYAFSTRSDLYPEPMRSHRLLHPRRVAEYLTSL